MQQGDCVKGRFPKPPKGVQQPVEPEPHYWFILTNPDANGAVIAVNVTTPRYPDQIPSKAQLLKKADYPPLDYDSLVRWKGAGPRNEKQILEAVKKGLFEIKPPLAVQKIREMVAEGAYRGLIPSELLVLLKAAGL